MPDPIRPVTRPIRQIHLPPKVIDMMGPDIRIVDDIGTRGLILIDMAKLNPNLAETLGKGWVVVAMPAETVG